MCSDLEIKALKQRAHGLAIRDDARRVRLQRGDDEIVHHLDLLLAQKFRFGLRNRRPGLRHVQPLLVLAEAHLDVADALEILVELVRVGLGEALLHALRIFEHGVEYAALLR